MLVNNLPLDDLETIRKSIDTLRESRIVLTGSKGFLGRWLAEILSPFCDLIPLDIIDGSDITNPQTVCNIDCDFIIHAAGNASPKVYQSKPLETIKVTVEGTCNLLDLANKNNARMVFLSSSEIYGDPTEVPTPEWYNGNVNCRGSRACYDESKRLAETLCQVYYELYNTRVITVRPFNVYGPGMNFNDGRAVPAFVNSIFNKKPITVFGDGKATRTYCYITDALQGILAALQYGKEGRVYNIGAENPEISTFQLAQLIRDLSNTNTVVDIVGSYPEDYPSDEPHRRCPDLIRAKSEFNYKPVVSLEDGLRRYLKWANIND